MKEKMNKAFITYIFKGKMVIISLFLTMLLIISCNTSSFAGIKAFLPDMSEKINGVYRGNYTLSGTPVKVTLDVTIQNNDIIEIKIIEHTSSPIGRKAERITQNIEGAFSI